jgi:hypothetical protein
MGAMGKLFFKELDFLLEFPPGWPPTHIPKALSDFLDSRDGFFLENSLGVSIKDLADARNRNASMTRDLALRGHSMLSPIVKMPG